MADHLKRGDKITYVMSNDCATAHGVVTSRKDDVFFFRPAYGIDGVRLSATAAQENCVWTRGHLRWWRPTDRENRKALLAAYALGDERIGLPGDRVSFNETLESAYRSLDAIFYRRR